MNETIMNNLIDLTPLLEGVIALLFILITAYLVPMIKANLTVAQQETLRDVVHVAVYAAEKLYGDGRGAQKLEHAEKYIREHYNAKVDAKALAAMIDAEIKDMELKDLTVVMDGAPTVVEEAETEDEEEHPDESGV